MKNRKNNKITLFTLFVIIITIIALIATSGTYAKYTSSVSTTASATVARWDITANGISMTDPEESTEFSFDIFETILDSDFDDEDDVADPLGATIIAPGTSGHKVLTIANNSDVTVKLTMAFAKQAGSPDVPIKFALVNGNIEDDPSIAPSASDFRDAATFATYLAGDPNEVNTEISYESGSNVQSYTLFWLWPYDTDTTVTTDDESDTDLGIRAASQTGLSAYNVSITITATQVD